MSTNRDQTKGRVKSATGTIKETVGKLVGNEKLEAKGRTEKVLGKARSGYGDAKQRAKDEFKR